MSESNEVGLDIAQHFDELVTERRLFKLECLDHDCWRMTIDQGYGKMVAYLPYQCVHEQGETALEAIRKARAALAEHEANKRARLQIPLQS